MLFTMISRVSFTSLRIHLFIQDQRILMLDRYHWIRYVLESKKLYLEKIYTNENGSDMLTKCLPKKKLEACRQRAGLVEPTT